MRLHFELILLIIWTVVRDGGSLGCNVTRFAELANCNDSRIQITSTVLQSYQLELYINQTSTLVRYIRCQDLWPICLSIPGPSGCKTDTTCEDEVDAFMTRYCGYLTLIANQATDENSIISQCNQLTLILSGVNPGGFQATTPILPAEGQSSMTSEANVNSGLTSKANNGPVVALGILLALSMVLLAAVTIGWVTTCLIMKKREEAKNSTHTGMDNGSGATVNTENNDEEERYFQNPTYGEGGPVTNTTTSTTSTGVAAMYAIVDKLSRRTRPTADTT